LRLRLWQPDMVQREFALKHLPNDPLFKLVKWVFSFSFVHNFIPI